MPDPTPVDDEPVDTDEQPEHHDADDMPWNAA